jgi:hypothetical protein
MDSALHDYNKAMGIEDSWTLNRLEELDSLPQVLTRFYREARLGSILESCKTAYDTVRSQYDAVARTGILKTLRFMKTDPENLRDIREIVIIPNLIGPGGEMGPEYRGVKYDIKGPRSSVSFSPHEFIHSLAGPLVREIGYEEAIQRITDPVWGEIENTPARKSYPDKMVYFEECLVRSLDGFITCDKNPAKLEKILEAEKKRGFILVENMVPVLESYSASSNSFADFFPEFLKKLENQ